MGAFFAEVYSEAVIFLFLAAVAVGGVFAGRALRMYKDKKNGEKQV